MFDKRYWAKIRDSLSMYQDKPVSLTRIEHLNLNYPYEQKTRRKPRGIWFSHGTEWFDFLVGIKDDDWGEERLSIYKRVLLFEFHKQDFLVLNTIEDVSDFVREFMVDPFEWDKADKDGCSEQDFAARVGITDWSRVAAQHKGIVVANPKLLHSSDTGDYISPFWGWDVTGGCVWDLSAIKEYEQIAVV